MSSFAIARVATPLFNMSNLRNLFGGASGQSLPLDPQRLFRPVESVVFPGSKFKVLEKVDDGVLRVSTQEYPEPVFVDQRFLELVQEEPEERARFLPPAASILNTMRSLAGTRYIWGGSWPLGVPALLQYYPPSADLFDPFLRDTWQLKGVDCSGLLYYAANGVPPRNTSDLVSYGQKVPIAGKTAAVIAKDLEPLDLIVWKGHVVIVLDQERVIESMVGEGVVLTPLVKRLEQIMHEKKRKPVDDYAACVEDRFVIRRWVSKEVL